LSDSVVEVNAAREPGAGKLWKNKQPHPAKRDQGAKARKEQPLCFLCAFYDFVRQPTGEMLLLMQGLFHSFWVLGVRRRGPFGIFDFGFRITPHLLPATFEEMAPITLSYHVGVIVCTFVQQDVGKWRVILCQVVCNRFSVALGVEKMGLLQP
jgi:hypothetical protein